MASTVFRIDTTAHAQDLIHGGDAVMAPGLFGGISISRTPLESTSFVESVDALGLTHLRWPGGQLSETAVVNGNGSISLYGRAELPKAYDLNHPDLMHPRALADAQGNPTGLSGFEDMLDLAVSRDASLSIILPTLRYADAPGQAAADVTGFLDALLVEGRWNEGVLPRKLILDIGNEIYDPATYGRVSAEILGAVRDFRTEHPEHDFTIALQGMQNGAETRSLIDVIQTNASEEGLLAEVDMVRVHDLKHGLRALRNFEHEGKADAIRELVSAIEADRDLLDIDGPDVEVYVSAWTVTSKDIGENILLPMPNASAMLSMFTGMAELGTDYAAGWGMGMDDASTPVVVSWRDGETGGLRLSPHGVVLRQMAESLPGTKVIAHPALDANRGNPVNLYAFEADDRAVLFLAANDLPANGTQVTVTLDNFGAFGAVSAESVSVASGLSGLPIVRAVPVSVRGSELTLTLNSDYQVVRVIVPRAGAAQDDDDDAPAPAPQWAAALASLSDSERSGMPMMDRGSNDDDTLRGGDSDDSLNGQRGDDRIYGGKGDDTMSGGEGNDTLCGGDGDDRLFGGLGKDTLITGGGNNFVSGGYGADHFLIDPEGFTVLTDFNAGQGDALSFGDLYESRSDLVDAMQATDWTGSGQNRDLLVNHAAMGATVILGGLAQMEAILNATQGFDGSINLGSTRVASLTSDDDIPTRPATPEDDEQPRDEDEDEDENTDGTGQGTCFVATAAYGDRLHPEVVWLRAWRDRVLVRTAAGRAFIRFYWMVGPRMARHVQADRPSGRAFRGLIRGIIHGLQRISPLPA